MKKYILFIVFLSVIYFTYHAKPKQAQIGKPTVLTTAIQSNNITPLILYFFYIKMSICLLRLFLNFLENKTQGNLFFSSVGIGVGGIG